MDTPRSASGARRRSRLGHLHRRPLGLLLVITLGGCGTTTLPVPPDLKAVGSSFRQVDAVQAEGLDAATWRGFGDPVLDSLIAQAREANLDVRIAQQRVRQARAGSTAAASRLWPTVALTSSVSDQRSGMPSEVKRGLPDTRAIRGALDIGWEVDVFGAARAAADAAELDALAADAGVQAAQWLASTEVARQYIIWLGARLRLQQLQALLQAQIDTERLTRSREAGGLASRFDASRAAAEVQTLTAQLPPLRLLVAASEAQMSVLLGLSPSAALPALKPKVEQERLQLPQVPALKPGQPIELLERRPDLQVARQQLLAEAARLRESQADLWPKFFLAAVLGQQDLRLNGVDFSPARYSNIALAFTAPLFNAGRLRAAVERQSARERSTTLQYERAVLGALQDVENSLVALSQERQRADSLRAAVDMRQRGLLLAQSLHREGQIDLLQLLDAQRGLIAAELALTDSQTQVALSAVQLVKALGGGWQTADAASAPARQTATTTQAAPPSIKP
ncbi:MAG: efflux transporter outer membrane subunit [Burkholderiales bacterium]|jgi:NodT family efflux transporter outer membrane factor (OMF) lipoprotein